MAMQLALTSAKRVDERTRQLTPAGCYSKVTTVGHFSFRCRVIRLDPFCSLPYVGVREARLYLLVQFTH